MVGITRRQLVHGAAAIAGSTLAVTAGPAQSQSATRLRAFWWGNPDRDKRLAQYLAQRMGVATLFYEAPKQDPITGTTDVSNEEKN